MADHSEHTAGLEPVVRLYARTAGIDLDRARAIVADIERHGERSEHFDDAMHVMAEAVPPVMEAMRRFVDRQAEVLRTFADRLPAAFAQMARAAAAENDRAVGEGSTP